MVALGILDGREPSCRTRTQMPFEWAWPLKLEESFVLSSVEFSVLLVGGGEEKAVGDSRVSNELERDLDRFEMEEI